MSNKVFNKSHLIASAVAASSFSMIGMQHVSAEQLLSTTELAQGYQVAMADSDKTAEGKCGADKAKATKAKEGKCGEAKCGANKAKATKAKEGKCGANK